MNNRRKLLIALGAGALGAPFGSFAQQQGKIWRVGYIGSAAGPDATTETFRQALLGLGYVEGRNLVIEFRWTGGSERIAELSAELVKLQPDIIASVTHAVSLEVMRATATIPVVFASVNDPVGVGLVPSLAHPGGNVTGLSTQGLDLIGKRLELLKELLPKMLRVAYLGNPDEPYSPAYLREAQRAGHALGLKEVFPVDFRVQRDIDAAFAKLLAKHPSAVLVEPNTLNRVNRSRIAEFAVSNRFPTMYGNRVGVDAGGLISYGQNLEVHFRRFAEFVDKILKGARPADLPVEQPMTFELVINMETAKALGIKIPSSIMLRADTAIK